MERPIRPVAIAVCGSPAAGKTTIASAVSTCLRVPLLTRDQLAVGFALGAQGSSPDDVRSAAEEALISVGGVLAASGVTFVVESSVLDESHLRPVLNHGGRVLVVHVVAPAIVIRQRLRDRVEAGDGAMRGLLDQHEIGVMVPEIFEPSSLATAVVTIDTSSGTTTSEHTQTIVDALHRLPR